MPLSSVEPPKNRGAELAREFTASEFIRQRFKPPPKIVPGPDTVIARNRQARQLTEQQPSAPRLEPIQVPQPPTQVAPIAPPVPAPDFKPNNEILENTVPKPKRAPKPAADGKPAAPPPPPDPKEEFASLLREEELERVYGRITGATGERIDNEQFDLDLGDGLVGPGYSTLSPHRQMAALESLWRSDGRGMHERLVASAMMRNITDRHGIEPPEKPKVIEQPQAPKETEEALRRGARRQADLPGAAELVPGVPGIAGLARMFVAKDDPRFQTSVEPTPQDIEAARHPLALERAIELVRSGELNDPAKQFEQELGERIPFAGGFVAAGEMATAVVAMERIVQGKQTPADVVAVAQFFVSAEEDADKNIAEKAIELASYIPTFAVEFGLTAGAFTVAKGLGIKAAKVTGVRAIRQQILRKLAMNTIITGGKVAGVAAQTLANPGLIARETASQMQKRYGLNRNEQNQLQVYIAKPEQDFMASLVKGVGSAFIEIGSERSGFLLNKTLGPIFRTLGGDRAAAAIKGAFVERWLKSGRSLDRFNEIVRRYGFDGILAEWFEERLGEATRGELGIEDRISVDLEQWAAEAAGFAVLPLGGAALSAATPAPPIPPSDQAPQRPHVPRESPPGAGFAVPRSLENRSIAEAEARGKTEPLSAPVPKSLVTSGKRGKVVEAIILESREDAEFYQSHPKTWDEDSRRAVKEGRRVPVVMQMLGTETHALRFEPATVHPTIRAMGERTRKRRRDASPAELRRMRSAAMAELEDRGEVQSQASEELSGLVGAEREAARQRGLAASRQQMKTEDLVVVSGEPLSYVKARGDVTMLFDGREFEGTAAEQAELWSQHPRLWGSGREGAKLRKAVATGRREAVVHRLIDTDIYALTFPAAQGTTKGPRRAQESQEQPVGEEGEGAEPAVTAEPQAEDVNTPVPSGHTRLYRAETTSREAADRAKASGFANVPEWLRESDEFKQTVAATGRWFYGTRKEAEDFARDFGAPGGISFVDIPNDEVEALRAINQPDVARHAAGPERAKEEFFVSRLVADRRRPLTEDAPPPIQAPKLTPDRARELAAKAIADTVDLAPGADVDVDQVAKAASDAIMAELDAAAPVVEEPAAAKPKPKKKAPKKKAATKKRRTIKIPDQFRKGDLEKQILKIAPPVTPGGGAEVQLANTLGTSIEAVQSLSASTFPDQKDVDRLRKEIRETDWTATEKRKAQAAIKKGDGDGSEVLDAFGNMADYLEYVRDVVTADTDLGRVRQLRKQFADPDSSAEFDPELTFLLHLHEMMSDKKLDKKDQDVINTADLGVGDTFKIHGEEFEITIEGGQLMLEDGVAIPLAAIEEVPVDKGTLEKGDSDDDGGGGTPVEPETPGPQGPVDAAEFEERNARARELSEEGEGAAKRRKQIVKARKAIEAKFGLPVADIPSRIANWLKSKSKTLPMPGVTRAPKNTFGNASGELTKAGEARGRKLADESGGNVGLMSVFPSGGEDLGDFYVELPDEVAGLTTFIEDTFGGQSLLIFEPTSVQKARDKAAAERAGIAIIPEDVFEGNEPVAAPPNQGVAIEMLPVNTRVQSVSGHKGVVSGPTSRIASRDVEVFVKFDNGTLASVAIRDLTRLEGKAAGPTLDAGDTGSQATFGTPEGGIGTAQGALFGGQEEAGKVEARKAPASGLNWLADELGLTQADYTRATPFLPSSGEPLKDTPNEAAFVNGVRQAAAGGAYVRTDSLTSKTKFALEKRGFDAYRGANPIAPSGESAAEKKIREKFGSGEGTEQFPELDPDRVRDMLDPGTPLDSIGAAPAEDSEVSARGRVRKKLRSAADAILGRGDDKATSERDKVYDLVADEDTRKRIKAARVGIGKRTLAQKLDRYWDAFKRGTQRGRFEFLPRTKELANARAILSKLDKARGVAQDHTFELLQRALKPLNATDYELFSLKVLLDDLAETGGDLPYGYTPAKVTSDKALVDREAASNERVQAAIEYRDTMWEAIRGDYIQAMEAVGYSTKDQLHRKNYFRHQVLHYARMQQTRQDKQRRLQTPTGRGFRRKRKGSQLDINANYLQAEWQVINQMVVDTQTGIAIKRITDEYDVLDSLKEQAKTQNMHTIYGGKENYERVLELRAEIASARAQEADPSEIAPLAEELAEKDVLGWSRAQFSRVFAVLRRMAQDGEFPEVPPKFHRAVNELITGRNELQDEPDPGEGLMDFLNWLSTQPGEAARPALGFFKAVQDRDKFIKEKAGDEFVEWRDVIPETHSEYVIRPGRTIYLAHSLQEGMAQLLLEEQVAELGVTKEDLRTVKAIGGPFRPLVLPTDLARQLDNLKNVVAENEFLRAWRVALREWKRVALLGPTRFIKYNIRNFSEVEKVLFANPSGLRKIPRAVKDLWKLFTHSEDVPVTVRDWAELGGLKGLTRVQEIGDVDRLAQFKRFLDTRTEGVVKKAVTLPVRAFRGYWNRMGMAVDYREAILRYATYLDYLDQMKRDPQGRPRNFGFSTPREIIGITDAKDKAYRLSNDLLGAYDDVAPLGQGLRRNVYPFWSFQETNMRGYIQGVRNLLDTDAYAWTSGKKLLGAEVAKKAPFLAVRAGRVAILLYGAHAALQAFNWSFFPDEEEEVPTQVKSRPHIDLGRQQDGQVRYFSRLGTSGDFMEWFGVDQAWTDAQDVLHNRRTLSEVVGDSLANPINKIVQGVSPFIKGPFELATGKSLFPDFRTPHHIRDRWEHIFRTVGLEQEYRAIAGKPGPEYVKERVPTLFLYTIEPNRASYSEIQSLKAKYRKSKGKASGFSSGARSDALRNYRLGVRHKDEFAMKKFMAEYVSLGGNKRGVQSSLKRMHPLGGLTKDEAKEFEASLTGGQKETLEKAIDYYEEVLNPKK